MPSPSCLPRLIGGGGGQVITAGERGNVCGLKASVLIKIQNVWVCLRFLEITFGRWRWVTSTRWVKHCCLSQFSLVYSSSVSHFFLLPTTRPQQINSSLPCPGSGFLETSPQHLQPWQKCWFCGNKTAETVSAAEWAFLSCSVGDRSATEYQQKQSRERFGLDMGMQDLLEWSKKV